MSYKPLPSLNVMQILHSMAGLWIDSVVFFARELVKHCEDCDRRASFILQTNAEKHWALYFFY